MKLPPSVDTERMFLRAIGKKVAYVAGSSFYFDEPERNAMRLNFSYPSLAQIDEGIARLASCAREELGLGLAPEAQADSRADSRAASLALG